MWEEKHLETFEMFLYNLLNGNLYITTNGTLQCFIFTTNSQEVKNDFLEPAFHYSSTLVTLKCPPSTIPHPEEKENCPSFHL